MLSTVRTKFAVGVLAVSMLVIGGPSTAKAGAGYRSGYGHGGPHRGYYQPRRGYSFGSSYYGGGGYSRPWGYSSYWNYAPGYGYSYGNSYYGGGFGYSSYGSYFR